METTCYINEVWKPVIGYYGLYEVSNFGRIRSLPRNGTINKERIIKTSTSNNGYERVGLRKNGVKKSFSVHRLVAIAFIPNPNNYPCVNHKNCIRTDNRVENLEWCTYEYNINYGDHNIKVSSKKKNNQKESRPVEQYTLDGVYITWYLSTREAERQTGVPHSNISGCCNNKPKHDSRGGFIWKWKVV